MQREVEDRLTVYNYAVGDPKVDDGTSSTADGAQHGQYAAEKVYFNHYEGNPGQTDVQGTNANTNDTSYGNHYKTDATPA